MPGGRHRRYHAWTQTLLERWTLSRLDRPRYRRAVDLGCGIGTWSTLLATRADQLHACDIAPGFVAETRARLAASDHRAWRVDCADIRAYTLPRRFDLAYVGSVLVHLSDRWAYRTLRRLREAADPGALVIVRDDCTFNLGRPSVVHSSGYSIHRRPRDIVDLATAAGLHCLEVRSSPSIYAEVMGNRLTRGPLWLGWRLATAHWLRASHTFMFRVPGVR